MRNWDARATAQRVQATEPSGCDRFFPGVGHFCRDRISKGGVARGCFSVAAYKASLRT